ncbi:thiol peroxidase [Telmatospirillum sp. J64-1]|uniref:thiol peroxidase n=1 Tax=Telmatospirillum sp. J64-1 TaxID=2502183 RepID=UPI00115D3411|nr:thiol peroxidase [Telmatospirillum sp. J64-1]
MAEFTLKGKTFHTSGELPDMGAAPPAFSLTKTDLQDVGLEDFAGKAVILNIFPSVDTATCAASVRRFNEEASKRPDTVVLCVSADLPFAHSRFCGAEGLDKVLSLSDMRDKDFGQRYGVKITDGPLAGLLARAVVVIGPDGKVIHRQLVSELSQEPDYDAALSALG